MPRPILIDTDVMVDFLRGQPDAQSLVEQCQDRIILPSIVVAELYAGANGDGELTVLDDLVSLFRIVPLTTAIARDAGLHRRTYGKSNGVGLADAVVAATTIAENADLKTLNVRHFPMFKGIAPAYTK